jgi:hypothetical protein
MAQMDRQLPAQKQARAMKPCLYGRDSQSNRPGNFFVGHALQIAQNDDASIQRL